MLKRFMPHFKNTWRTHSCVPRRDSSRRSLVIYTNSEVSVETNLDATRTSARAAIFHRALYGLIGISFVLSAQQPTTFQTSTQLVIQTVNVKDKSGKPIEGLTAKDFTVTEDGVPQTIKFFEFQKLDEEAQTPITTPAPVNVAAI